MMDNQPKTRPTPFTVMELAVIIVVMLTLISVLIPVVSGAKKRQDQANCQNNQMVIGLATADWLETHDGYLPTAKSKTSFWFEQLDSTANTPLPLRCAANTGRVSEDTSANYGWNSYLGDVDLTDAPTSVRTAWLQRPSEILLSGDGTVTGEQTTSGAPTIWPQKTWRRESQQALAHDAIHGENLNYLFADLHVAPIALDNPYLIANPAGFPNDNYWVELINPAPGPFFNTPKETR